MRSAAASLRHLLWPALRIMLLVLAIAAAGRAVLPSLDDRAPLGHMVDFDAFYCAARAALAHRDPYRAEPLRSCEQALTQGAGGTRLVAMPAPLPGYDVALFEPLARRPIAIATIVYFCALVAALGASAILLARLTAFSRFGTLCALLLCDGWVSLGYGQIVAFALMFLCAAAYALARNQPIVAAACSAAAMIEPHIALPACIALAVFSCRTRLPLGIAGVVLIALSLVAIGPLANREYLLEVLPAHALAESDDIGQLSLTGLAHQLGVRARAALMLGELSYIVTLASGLIVARRLALQMQAAELLVLIPPAITLVGGPFIHTSQMAIAIPAVIVLMKRALDVRWLLAAALLLLTVPWLELAENPLPASAVAVAATTTGIAILILRLHPLGTTSVVLLTTAAAVAERWVRTTFPPSIRDMHAELARMANGSLLADATWAIHTRSREGAVWYFASHGPTWLGLGLLVGAMLAIGRTSVVHRLAQRSALPTIPDASTSIQTASQPT